MKERVFIEKIKMVESIRVPILGKYWFQSLSKLEQKVLDKESIPLQPLNQTQRDTVVICSMTSFPARINYVHIALKSLMLQSYKPDRIILWLANEQFPDHVLPKQLTDLVQYGLEIKWCDDLYGHKKYYYCVREQKPNEVVITFDDDIIYPVDAVKRLMRTHEKYPNCIVCERAQSIDYDENGELKNPGRWKTISDVGVKTPSYSLNPSPGGGCLIPYCGFYEDALKPEVFCSLAYKNDDLWYMFMAAQNKTRIIKTQKYHKIFSLIDGSQTIQMATENVAGDRNKVIMEGLIQAYPEAYRRILTDKD